MRLRSAAMVELETTQKLMAALFVEFGGAQVCLCSLLGSLLTLFKMTYSALIKRLP